LRKAAKAEIPAGRRLQPTVAELDMRVIFALLDLIKLYLPQFQRVPRINTILNTPIYPDLPRFGPISSDLLRFPGLLKGAGMVFLTTGACPANTFSSATI
jgi:hypothetical protein